MKRGDLLEVVILFIIILILNTIVGSVRDLAKGGRRRDDAVEEQRRRRAAYEAEHGPLTAAGKPSDAQRGYSPAEHPYDQRENSASRTKPTLVRKPIPVEQPGEYPLHQPAPAGAIPEQYLVPTASAAPQIDAAPSLVLESLTPLQDNSASPTVGGINLAVAELQRGIVMAEVLGPCRAKRTLFGSRK